MTDFEEAVSKLRNSDTAVAFTGAGVSTASGIPDFRSEGGIWDRYDPSNFHITNFEQNPEEFWQTWIEIREELGNPEPNTAHNALADMYHEGVLDAVVTQNVDGLHQEAGIPDDDVVELHGNSGMIVCRSCHDRTPVDSLEIPIEDLPPKCDCGGTMKPNSTLFGEKLPEHAIYKAHSLTEDADAFLVAGSSLTVEPAASLPEKAMEYGAELIIVNHDQTRVSHMTKLDYRADVTDVLPELRDRLV